MPQPEHADKRIWSLYWPKHDSDAKTRRVIVLKVVFEVDGLLDVRSVPHLLLDETDVTNGEIYVHNNRRILQ